MGSPRRWVLLAPAAAVQALKWPGAAPVHVDAVALLEDILAIPSPSGQEADLAAHLEARLQDAGLAPERVPVPEGGHDLRCIVGTPRVWLATHLDTVPGELPVRSEGGVLHGRGACDAKGSAAAMVAAVVQAARDGVDGFGLLLTVGEETDLRGARAVGELPFVVVGEPTDLHVLPGTFGTLSIRLKARGKRAHTATPHEGDNAIEALMAALQGAGAAVPTGAWQAVTGFHGGIADNVVPDAAEATVNLRYPPGADIGPWREALASFEAEVLKEADAVRGVESVPAALQEHPVGDVAPYITELSVYRNGVVFGPGRVEDAHTDHDRVRLADVEAATVAYRDMLTALAQNGGRAGVPSAPAGI